ncbi:MULTISPECIES: alpha/beta fold hydrolase [Exiguobacterium]|jgi:pimeloyl-ACP methyl ester carboxylesterase|uniref:alpha/beta fold hydrolase n=1 Tax=Exiguobacterium TaxID=33986 RepID=UPI00110F4941|nr:MULTISPECIES: alpha/beta hydrolase [Exiguobacterium]
MLHYKTYTLSDDHPWVIFIHGAGGSLSHWYRQIRPFKKKYNVLLLDLRGHGGSYNEEQSLNQPLNAYTLDVVVEDVVEVMDHLKIEKGHMVGLSLGTIVIQAMFEHHPERIASVVLGGAIVKFNVRSTLLIRLGSLVQSFVPYMWLYQLFAWILLPKKRHKKSRMMFVRDAANLCQREFIRWFKMTENMNPLLRHFSSIETNVPILYIMGDEDYMFLEAVERTAKHQPTARVQVVSDSGHVVNVDQPDHFNSISMAFIDQQVGSLAASTS